ncbi:MAG: hypothetical protein GY724_18335 [Actinomycetia bacterium]|nr:hypothetical protein [Actinomycetes bacterium]
MEMGPLQLVVVGFDHPTLDGSILTELMKLSDQGLVRLVDLLGVYKSDSGELAAVELSDLGLDEAITYGAWVGALLGLGAAGEEGLEVWAFAGALLAENEFEYGLDEEAIRTIGNDIPNGGGALIGVLEHRWAIPLRSAVQAQGGIAIVQDFLNPETLIAMGAVAGAELID